MQVNKLVRGSAIAITALAASMTGHESRRNEFDNLNTNQPVAKRNLNESELYGITKVKSLSQPLCADEHKQLIKFEDDKNGTLSGKICRAYIPNNPKDKPLFVLVLGHVEELDWSGEYSGIIHFYERLIKEDKGTVLLFRTGLATHEIETMFSPETKKQYEPNIVLKQTKDIIKDFIIRYKPKELRCAGFSWGGGTIARLAQEDSWRQGIPVKSSVMIDPICFGSLGFGSALRTRPEFKDSPEHKNFHVYQRNDNLPIAEWFTTIQGNYPVKLVKDKEGKLKAIKDERPGDVIWHVPNTSHLEIDDLDEVRKRAYEFLISS